MQRLASVFACLLLIGGWADEVRCDPPGAAEAPSPVGPTQLFRSMAASSVRASRAANHLIGMQGDWNAETATAQERAARAVAEAFVALAAEPRGQVAMDRVHNVRIVTGRRPSASLSVDTLIVTVAAASGDAGWPSTEAILVVLRAR